MLVALALAVLSGATWLLFLASRIAQTSVAEAIGDGTAWSVLTETQFGHVWEGRLLVAILLFCVALVGPGVRTRGLRLHVIAGGTCGSFCWDARLVRTRRGNHGRSRSFALWGRRIPSRQQQQLGSAA